MQRSEKQERCERSLAGLARHGGSKRRRVPWRLFALASMALAVGCASNFHSRASAGKQVDLNEPHPQTKDTLAYINQQANQHHVPDHYVSEARVGMADVESKRDAARAGELERDARYHEQVARVAAQRQDAVSNEQSALAEAEKLREEFDAQHSETSAKLAARERKAKAANEADNTYRSTLAKKRMTAQTDLISRAEHEFTQAQARIEQVRSIRQATEKEGLAAIDEMQESAKATRARAAAVVARLRTEGQSAHEQTQAQLAEVRQQIKTVKEKSAADASRLLAQAGSTEQDSQAEAKGLEARSVALETQASQQEYDLKVTAAKTERQKAQAAYDRQVSASQSLYEKALAEIERLRGDSNVTIQKAESDFARELSELDAWYKQALADVGKIRAKANRLEQTARADFVKAEAEARAKAMRETAQHQDALAEAQMKSIIAEAQAEAARLREQILAELARKKEASRVDFEGKTDPVPEEPTDLHAVPKVPTVAKVTPIVEPEHVAKYRSNLAAVMRERVRADANETALTATHTEGKKKLEAIKTQQLAIAAEQFAAADALEKKAGAAFAERNAQIEAKLAVAKSSYNRAIVEAGAFRKEALADTADLRAKAKARRDWGAAQGVALRKEADVVSKNGRAEVQALEAEVHATNERGQAAFNRLTAEAASIEQAEAALAAQIDAGIQAAQQTLTAELVKLDRQTETSTAVAQANYEQTLVQAEVLGRKTEVAINRLQAQEELDQTLTLADIERQRDEMYVNQIRAEAEVERLIASAQAEREQTEAVCDAEQVAIRSQADVTTANVKTQRQIAAAREQAIKAVFDARLAQTDSGRILKATAKYWDDSFYQNSLETALAEAQAARAESQSRLAKLIEEQKELQRAAIKNWDARLAQTRDKDYRDVTNDASPQAPSKPAVGK